MYGEKTFWCFKAYTAELFGTCKHGRAASNIALRCPNVQKFIYNNKEKFDVVIAEFFAEEPTYVFAHKYKAPLVLISSFDYDFPTFAAIGVHTIWSNIPQLQGTFDLSNNFVDRFLDRVFTAILVLFRKAIHINDCNKIAEEVFGDYDPPSVKELEKDAALVMFNSLEILGESKLREQGFVNIAGVHIQPVQPMRKYIQVLTKILSQ
jgi:glucuronosyltransferase